MELKVPEDSESGAGSAFGLHLALSDVLDLGKLSQITGDRFQELAEAIAGPFRKQITSIFKGNTLAVYILTDPICRNVWHAHLAGTGHNTSPTSGDLLDRFLRQSSEGLVKDAFGSCPIGYLAALKRFPAKVQSDVGVFGVLHRLLTQQPHLATALHRECYIEVGLIRLLAALPARLQMVSVAQAFGCNPRAYAAFTAAYRAVTSHPDICEEDAQRLINGEKPRNTLRRRYHSLPFPAPALANTERIQHLRYGEALCAAAAEFSNCLRNFSTRLTAMINNSIKLFLAMAQVPFWP